MRTWPLIVVLVVFAIAWGALMGLKLTTNATDVPVFYGYGELMRQGHVPYRNFSVEYPPGALAPFALPALVAKTYRGYRIAFEVLMGLCGLGTIAVTWKLAARLGDRPLAPAAFVGAAIIGLGPLSLGHFDLWPALLVSSTLLACLLDRRLLSGVLIGVAIAAKIYAIVLVPLVFVWFWRGRGLREAWAWLATATATTVACFLPFVALSPGGVWWSIRDQTSRPLQLESSASAALLAAHQLFSLGVGVAYSHTSVNLGGTRAGAAAAASTLAEVLVLVVISVAFARRSIDGRALVRAATAAVLAFVVVGKVFSPQFLLWLIPLVPLLGGGLAVSASATLAVSELLTRLYFPSRWAGLRNLQALPTWLLVARDACLLALLAFLLAVLLKRPAYRVPSAASHVAGTPRRA